MEQIQLFIGQPFGLKDLIRRIRRAHQAIFLPPVIQLRPLQQLQKTDLKLVRPHSINGIKRIPKALHPLKGKTGDQIQMQVDILLRHQRLHHLRNAGQIRPSMHAAQRIRVGRLHADFHLDQPRPQFPQQCQLFLRDPVRLYLKMKIGFPVIMIAQIPPDLHRKIRARIKSPVNKFDLLYPLIQKKLQLLLHHIQIPAADSPLSS